MMARILVPVLLCAAATALTATAGHLGDFAVEALPAYRALTAGDPGGFAALAPAYGGALVLRAPVAVAAAGAGDLWLYRATAWPCLLAAALLGWALWRRATAGRHPAAPAPSRAVVALAAAVLPLGAVLALDVLDAGHPEEALAACLAVGAVLLGAERRWALAGLALGLAVATKPWALLAVGPVLLALPSGVRLRAALVAGATGAAVLAPLLGAAATHLAETTATATGTGNLFRPQQLWWPLREAQALPGGAVAYAGPEWLRGLTHPLIVLLALPLSLGFARVRRDRPASDALLLLALLCLLRCLLDPWNALYYVLPCALALGAWEVENRRAPSLAAGVLALSWLSFAGLRDLLGWDELAAVYLVWSVPAAAALVAATYRPALLVVAGRKPAPA